MIIELSPTQLKNFIHCIWDTYGEQRLLAIDANVAPQTLSRQIRSGKFDEAILLKYLYCMKLIPTIAPYISLNKLENWVMTLPSKHTHKLIEVIINGQSIKSV